MGNINIKYNKSAEIVQRWLQNIGFELAVHKSEARIITNTRTHNNMPVFIGGDEIEAGKNIRYLAFKSIVNSISRSMQKSPPPKRVRQRKS